MHYSVYVGTLESTTVVQKTTLVTSMPHEETTFSAVSTLGTTEVVIGTQTTGKIPHLLTIIITSRTKRDLFK